MSSPISPGLHRGLEALRRWTSGGSYDSFPTHVPADTFQCGISDTVVDIQGSGSAYDPALHNCLPVDYTSEVNLARNLDSNQQQFIDTQRQTPNAWDSDSSIRELFPGMDYTPALGSYSSPTATSVGTPTSTFNRMNTTYTSAARQDLANDPNIPEHSESGYGAAESPYRSYAQLLFQCLYEAYNFERSLKDIYRWMQDNTKKGRTGESAGWMNSVRHNLSMNAAFQRVPNKRSTSKKDSTWRLTPEAITNGIFSTTRYRTKEPKKSTKQLRDRDSKRVAAGAKGGLASRRSAELNRRQHAVRKTPPTQSTRQFPLGDDMLLSSMPTFLPPTASQSFATPGPQYPAVSQPPYNNYGQVDRSLPSYFYDSSAGSQQLLTPTSMSVNSNSSSDETSDVSYSGQGAGDLFGVAYSDNGFGLMPYFDGQCSPPLELQ